MRVNSDTLLAQLREQGVSYEYYEHIPLHTVEDAKKVQGNVISQASDVLNIKNLYLRDRKKRNYLVVLEQDRVVDLAALGGHIGAGKLSFGSPERLMEHLGVRPGAVTPLAMVTGAAKGVHLYMDRMLETVEKVHVHPLVNDRTVTLRSADLLTLLDLWGVTPMWLDF